MLCIECAFKAFGNSRPVPLLQIEYRQSVENAGGPSGVDCAWSRFVSLCVAASHAGILRSCPDGEMMSHVGKSI